MKNNLSQASTNPEPITQEGILLYNKGCKALLDNKHSKAEIFFKKSLRQGESTDCYLNLGTTYKALDKDILCVEALTKATSDSMYSMETSFNIKALALNNLGLMAYVRGEDALALEYYEEALKLHPELYDCQWNRSTCMLRQVMCGDHSKWADAWDTYESRFKKSSCVRVHNVFGFLAEKVWNGQRDCRIVVAQEQGIGDNIMFARFIPQLEKDYNIKVDFQIDESLGCLLRANGISCPVKIDVRDYDYMLPVGSICRWISYVDSAPYIFSNPMQLNGPKELNIGLVYSGSPSHTNDRHRSCPVGYLKFLSSLGNVYSLNPGAKNLPSWINSLDLPNWTTTAAALEVMDFVVTVDTSVAHLSGAMGRPTYMLQPRKETDFRHGLPVTEEDTYQGNNIWYDSMTVIPNPNSWEKCIENLKREIYK